MVEKIFNNKVDEAIYLIEKNSKEPIPLESIHFKVDILASLASFTMTQKYVNSSDDPLETLFLFPMDVDYAISKIIIDFTLPTGETRSLETIVDIKEKAEIKYEDAIAGGTKTAVMASFTKGQRDMMRVMIGNFPAQTTAVLKILYFQ
jgi:hypothetical protein